jgi:DNA methylase
MDYQEFLKAKASFDYRFSTITASDADVHPLLLPHQRAIVRWAVEGGRRAIFAAFGLGKTMMQLEIVRITSAHAGLPGLIICPLGVRQEFAHDARMLGIPTRFIRRAEEIPADDTPGTIYLTNYESVRDDRLDVTVFSTVSLDEASVLRSYGSKTYQTFMTKFDQTPFRFVATATPSPNRFKELIHYAGFLGVMDTGQALTRFFQRDSTKANNLTIYPHKEQEFWLWLASWSIFLQRPSDLGFDDTGYDLPELDIRLHEIATVDPYANVQVDRQTGQSMLIRDARMGVVGASKEKRDTLTERLAKVAELVAEAPDDHFILWHDLEAERHALKRLIPEAVEVYGSLDLEIREQRVIDFSEGRSRLLATKPELSGSGCNFQRFCHRAIFAGIGFQFNDFVQAIHRIHRFLQPERCRIDIIYAESEREVLKILLEKWENHKELTTTMSNVIREHGLNQMSIQDALQRSLGVERVQVAGEGWMVANNDTVAELEHLDDNSLDMIVTSIPFANHYEYTPSYNDFGHTDNNEHFWAQMDFLTPGLLRALKPGRIYACHTKDRIKFGNVTGAGVPTVSPFHAEALFHGMKHGFDYLGMITVVTDVVRENNQSYRLGWSENCKDSTKMGVGSPEYILLFRKPQTDRTRGYADTPVTKTKETYSRSRWQVDAHAFWRSSGDRQVTPEELAELPVDQVYRIFTKASLEQLYDFESHVTVGEMFDGRGQLPSTFMLLNPGSRHPDVWHDVNRMLTLNTEQSRKALAMHVCPLQFDIVDRLINRYTNPGDLVYDPFGGLFTVPLRALMLGRRGRGVELNAAYFADGVKYLQAAEAKLGMPTLFDVLDVVIADDGVEVGS